MGAYQRYSVYIGSLKPEEIEQTLKTIEQRLNTDIAIEEIVEKYDKGYAFHNRKDICDSLPSIYFEPGKDSLYDLTVVHESNYPYGLYEMLHSLKKDLEDKYEDVQIHYVNLEESGEEI